MTLSVEQIAAEVLSLPHDERKKIAATLVESLGPDPDIDPATYAEVLRRVAEIRSGTAEMIPGEEFFKELEEFLREDIPVPSKGTR
jgi:putative addiction module component (TIGR02574 family)